MKKLPLMIICFVALNPISQPGYGAEISPDKIPEVSRTIIQRTEIEGSDNELRFLVAYRINKDGTFMHPL
ncbi:MAG: hypothetical protein PHF31_01220 [Methylobacter sp.]|nr:hypothetical protein [Methylobacter sp.]